MSEGYRDLKQQVGKTTAGLRLDQALAELFDLSRRRARRALDEGGVYLNNKRCRTAGRSVATGDRLRVVLLENEALVPMRPEQLIWQQGELYAIHKLSGQYAQEALHRSRGTLPDELAKLLQLKPAVATRLRPVHRLDRGTSGVMLFCSDPKQPQHLQSHWAEHAFKRYLAVVEPAPEWDVKRITLSIGKRRDHAGRYHVDPEGRPCDSEAKVIERRGNRALVELIPHTGRTHQLRIHLAALECPILGDVRYGGKPHSRLMLHAESLRLRPPALNEEKEWHIPPEENWQW